MSENDTIISDAEQKEHERRVMRAVASHALSALRTACGRARVKLDGDTESMLATLSTAPTRTLVTMHNTLPEAKHAAPAIIAVALPKLSTAEPGSPEAEALLKEIDNALVFGPVLDAAAWGKGGYPFAETMEKSLALKESGAERIDYLMLEEPERLKVSAYVLASLLDWRRHGSEPQAPNAELVEAVEAHAHRPEWVFQQSLERGSSDPALLLDVLGSTETAGAEGFL